MTFSIVARDSRTGALGVATATGGPVVGSLVPHARAGVGAIATQSTTNPLYGFDGLDRLEHGGVPTDVLAGLTAADEGREHRQCLMIDAEGRKAAWTGAACTQFAGTLEDRDVLVGGNLLATPDVLPAMIDAFLLPGALEDRLLAALVAGHSAGGDSRGARSAGLKVYTSEPYPAVDLRVDWSINPIAELGRVLAAAREHPYASFFQTIPSRAHPSGRRNV
jgi:uncharacterized Ntn-hydrolase superfamily protein